MYVITNHNSKICEWSEARHLRSFIDDLDTIVQNNEIYRDFLNKRDSGRPGHYYGREAVIEGSMPVAAFHIAALEFGGDELWYLDDAKFQQFMERHPEYNWLNG